MSPPMSVEPEEMQGAECLPDQVIDEQKRLEDQVKKMESQENEHDIQKLSEMNTVRTEKQLNLLLERASAFSNLLTKQIGTDNVRPQLGNNKKRRATEALAPASLKLSRLSCDTNTQNSDTQPKRGRKPKIDQDSPTDRENKDMDPEKMIDDARKKMAEADAVHDDDDDVPKYLTGGTLRPYQLEGFRWLKTRHLNGINGILADEMGLGKTVQTIAVICHLYEMGVAQYKSFLIIGPLSTLHNWVDEFHRFAPSIPVFLYHGSKEERGDLRQELTGKHEVDGKKVHPVFVTSYEVMINDAKFLGAYNFGYIIIDEGHRLKNYKCKLLTELRRLPQTENNRLLLTGTPLQNNLTELWSLLNYLMPDVFSDLDWFRNYFDFSSVYDGKTRELLKKEKEGKMIAKLHSILQPFLLRRVKADVELEVPPKRELLVYAPMTVLQQQYYEWCVNKTLLKNMNAESKNKYDEIYLDGRKRKSRSDVDYKVYDNDKMLMQALLKDDFEDQDDTTFTNKTTVIATVGEKKKCRQFTSCVRNPLMALRKICIHPYLLEHPVDEFDELTIDDTIVTQSGKMMVLDRLLQALKQRGHKVLIFSQFTCMLDLIQDYCYLRNFDACRLDGTMKLDDRQQMIRKFNNEAETFVFLVSTRAGGLGINLTAADTVIIFDSDWNPQSDLQAQDRCHRIGQTKPVMVYRLVTKSTVDEKLVEAACKKRRVEKMVIHKDLFKFDKKGNVAGVSAEELIDLLKSTDYSATLHAADQGAVISDKDMQLILDRSKMCSRDKINVEENDAFSYVG